MHTLPYQLFHPLSSSWITHSQGPAIEPPTESELILILVIEACRSAHELKVGLVEEPVTRAGHCHSDIECLQLHRMCINGGDDRWDSVKQSWQRFLTTIARFAKLPSRWGHSIHDYTNLSRCFRERSYSPSFQPSALSNPSLKTAKYYPNVRVLMLAPVVPTLHHNMVNFIRLELIIWTEVKLVHWPHSKLTSWFGAVRSRGLYKVGKPSQISSKMLDKPPSLKSNTPKQKKMASRQPKP